MCPSYASVSQRGADFHCKTAPVAEHMYTFSMIGRFLKVWITHPPMICLCRWQGPELDELCARTLCPQAPRSARPRWEKAPNGKSLRCSFESLFPAQPVDSLCIPGLRCMRDLDSACTQADPGNRLWRWGQAKLALRLNRPRATTKKTKRTKTLVRTRLAGVEFI